jgi:hypothetical protein
VHSFWRGHPSRVAWLWSSSRLISRPWTLSNRFRAILNHISIGAYARNPIKLGQRPQKYASCGCGTKGPQFSLLGPAAAHESVHSSSWFSKETFPFGTFGRRTLPSLCRMALR